MAAARVGAPSREPHTWRVRRIGLRGRLASKGWGIRGPHAEKVIAGRTVVVTALGEHGDWVMCRFERRLNEIVR